MDHGWNFREIVRLMRASGFYQRVMAAGPELDRVKAYLETLGGERAEEPGPELQHPNYPRFPGLQSQPYYEGPELEGVRCLEAAFDTIRDEVLRLPRKDFLRYAPSKMSSEWYLYLLHHMGVPMGELNTGCPATLRVLASLPGLCVDYPWGDAFVSVLVPGAHLGAHCSVDGLRLRCHLAIETPDGCSIRVGAETRAWEQGRALVFDDSFEHEVWHRGASDRVVLIVDFWHPGLTLAERRALTVGFRQAGIRRLLYTARLRVAEDSSAQLRFIEEAINAEERNPPP